MHDLVVAKIKKFPHQPGVYFFKDTHGQIIYIGKAKDLKNRCNSYLQHDPNDHKNITLHAEAADIETTVVATELAAAILEAELIAQHRPRLNVLLKDGQPFVYFVITDQELPRLEMVRNQKKKGTYFGPFIEKAFAQRLYKFLIKTFQLQLCNHKIAAGCLYYHLGVCAGNCRPDFNREAYAERLMLVKKLLRGGNKACLQELAARIEAHNERMEFEASKKLYQCQQDLEHFFAGKDAIIEAHEKFMQRGNRHVWIATETEVVVMSERHLVFKELYRFKRDVPDAPIDDYVFAVYHAQPPAMQVFVDGPLEDEELLKNFLIAWWKLADAAEIITSFSDYNEHVVMLARLQVLERHERVTYAGAEIAAFLNLPTAPRVIDCFDISHLQGTEIVGSAVRFVDGVPDKNEFRKFNIQSLIDQNDYAALQEVAARRYKDPSQYPDLLLIDGGKGQLSAVRQVLPDAECASIAKKEERIFSPRLAHEGKVLIKRSKAGKTLMALRDYAHHFAISHQRVRRLKQFAQ